MHNSILIEKMTESDLNTVCEMDSEVYGDEKWPREWFAEAMGDSYAYYFIAYWDNEPAGYCGMYHNTSKTPHYCKVTILGVRPEFRRKGIGRALMLEILKTAKGLDLDRAKLEVNTKNSAVRLYESLGFKVEAVEEGYYDKSGGDAYIMWRYDEDAQ